ncbi:hypothetical protein P7K49_032805 [Saguinus oedipus]|uniref:Uncharacterized protein n=1 Tax=Saguinus oedipus TaxID=9490 RepID=A0ABQ9TQ41_SAGOE|nr:hypothetical protein P7K49_032805 [Saguinus oedipus]
MVTGNDWKQPKCQQGGDAAGSGRPETDQRGRTREEEGGSGVGEEERVLCSRCPGAERTQDGRGSGAPDGVKGGGSPLAPHGRGFPGVGFGVKWALLGAPRPRVHTVLGSGSPGAGARASSSCQAEGRGRARSGIHTPAKDRPVEQGSPSPTRRPSERCGTAFAG